MLFEAHGRQNKSSNDESYVGSEGRFSERAASQYTESPAAPMSARAFFEVFPRSIVFCVGIAVALSLPQINGQQHRMGCRWFFPLRGPRERRTDKRLGVIRRSTAAWHVALRSRAVR